MTTDLATTNNRAHLPEAVEKALVQGNLADLKPEERVSLYRRVCESLGLNPLTQPFAYITLSGKLTFYATRNATDQLRALHNVGVSIVSRERIEDVYVVTARATLPNGRTDESIGAVSIKGQSGDALCNSLMKAETKSKRRVTLSIVGLSFLDESEVETVRDARVEPLPALDEPDDGGLAGAFADMAHDLEAASSLAELSAVWQGVHKSRKLLNESEIINLATLKDECKRKLEADAALPAS